MMPLEDEAVELLQNERKAKTPEERAYWESKIKEYFRTHVFYGKYDPKVLCFM